MGQWSMVTHIGMKVIEILFNDDYNVSMFNNEGQWIVPVLQM